MPNTEIQRFNVRRREPNSDVSEHFFFRPEFDSGVCMFSSGCQEPQWHIVFGHFRSRVTLELTIGRGFGIGLI